MLALVERYLNAANVERSIDRQGSRGKLVRRTVFILAAAWTATLAAPATAAEQSVTYASAVPLAASLLTPEGKGPFPALVVVHGSGRSDRSNAWARDISEMLVKSGYAVLLTDKRGSGKSGGDWRTASFDDLAADSLAGVAFLKSNPIINARRIGLIGLSQGGRVVPIAAVKSDDVAFVIDLVGDAVSFAEQSLLEIANIGIQQKLSAREREALNRLNLAGGRAVITGQWSEYQQLRKDGLRSSWSKIAAGFPPAGDPVWQFYTKSFAFDPMPYWVLARQPALIVFGEADETDNVAVGESKRRLEFGFSAANKRNYAIKVVNGVGHSLGWKPGVGLDGEATRTIIDWLASNSTPK
jgi:pimeloyl-ACP methyl ester carboxylesterase